MTAQHILVVDDDPQIRRLLRRCFEMEGFRVSEAEGADSVTRAVTGGGVDLITLDLNLGADDGIAIARDIRNHSNVPIIMVTGKGDMVDKVVGLEIGADDYIAKPFHVREVLARVRSVLRRAAPAMPTAGEEEVYTFSGWTFNIAKRELLAENGEICPLTTGEFDMLALFVKRANRVLNRDQIMDLNKGHDWNPFDRSIDNQIARLRKKIEADPKRPQLLKTVRGAGYSFTATVTRTR